MNKAQLISDLIFENQIRPDFVTGMPYTEEEVAALKRFKAKGTWACKEIRKRGLISNSVTYEWYFISDAEVVRLANRMRLAERIIQEPLSILMPLAAASVLLYAAWDLVADFAWALSAAL